ncbi:MAG TPA: M23 family metallopeptidase, partial [Puia sp.]|nr:M23 family metallopeptidase [Puia sp.]
MKYLFAVLAWLLPAPGFSQSSPSLFTAPDYPQGYFRDPLDIPMSLAANFGELRVNHYHMGLDIRTQHRENLPVHAAADGYVCRVEIAPEGFGQAIYIRHPNGYTTVYGHLNRFFPALAAYVAAAQYREQSWQVDLTLQPSLFPVRKGELIAYSGNTGGSQGPHLHFEIRRTRDNVNLNPLLFGLPVPDRVPPTILRLAWYDAGRGVYDQSPGIVDVHPEKRNAAGLTADYAISAPVLELPVPRVGFAISAFDTQTGSRNPNGIYRAVLSEDDRTVIGFQLDRISYDDTRNINAHIDYKTRNTGGPFLQQLFLLPGYPFPSIYRVPGPSGGVDPAAAAEKGVGADEQPAPGRPEDVQRQGTAARAADGFMDISDGRVHDVRIDVTDPRGNRGRLAFEVRYAAAGVAGPPPGVVPAVSTERTGEVEKTFYPGMID